MVKWNPLIRALVREDFNEEELSRIVEDDPDHLRMVTKLGSTPLHFAALRKDPRFVTFLLERGAEANTFNFYRETALHWAVKAGGDRVVSVLMEAGALSDLADADNGTPIDWAEEEGHTHLLPLLQKRTRRSSRPAIIQRCLSLVRNPNPHTSLPPT